MKKLLLFLGLLISMSVLTMKDAKATHISGGNFEWQCIGQDSFLITLHVFRFCDQAIMPGSVNMQFQSPCGSFNTIVQRDSMIEVSQLCDAQKPNSSCNNGPLPGMQHGFFSTIVELPPCPSGPWTMYYSVCCRNTTANIQGTATQGPAMTIEAMLYNNIAPCNNSPSFEAQPIPYVCDGQEVQYSWGATESDGDSLVFFLAHPWAANLTTPVQYVSPYSATNPLNVPVTLDSNTGQLTFTPQATPGAPFWVVKVCVEEYRNGVLIGVICRDVQFNVQQCDNVFPWMTSGGITNFSGNGVQIDSNTVELCVGNNISFDVIFEDSLTPTQVVGDSITITTNAGNVLPGATVNITNGNPATFSISWTAIPTASSFNTITVNVKDDACPITGINSFNFSINVIPSTYAGPDLELCEDDTGFISVVGGSQFTWSVLQGDLIAPGFNFSDTTGTTGQNVWVFPSQTTTYRVESDLSSTCDNADTITVELFEYYNPDFFLDTPFCVTDIPDTAVPVTTSPPGVWSGPGITDGQIGAFDPGLAGAGMIPVKYEIESFQGNCNTDTTIMIEVVPLPDVSIDPPHAYCYTGGPYTVSAATPGGVWSGSTVIDSVNGVIDPSSLSAPGSAPIYYKLTYPCVNRDTVDLLFYQEYEFDLVDTPLILCTTDTASLNEFVRPISIGPTGPGPIQYTWNGPGVTNSDSGWFRASQVPGLNEVTLTVEASDSTGECSSTKTLRVLIQEPEQPEVTGPLTFCSDIEQAAILTDPQMSLGNWEITPIPPTNYNLNVDPNRPGRINPENTGPGQWDFRFSYTDINGCLGVLRDTIKIFETPEPPVVDSNNFCVDEEMILTAEFQNHPDSLTWYDNSFADESTLIGTGTPYFYGIATEDDMGTTVYVNEKNGGCISELVEYVLPVKRSPNAHFLMTFIDSTETEQTFGSSTFGLVKGPAPLTVSFEATEWYPDTDSLFIWDLWVDCSAGEALPEQPCPLTFEGPDSKIEMTYEKDGEYYVRHIKTNIFGCADTVDSEIEVQTAQQIPNVFTPNGDGENDRFYIPGANALRDFRLVIYNRWGRIVAEITDPKADAGWDGGDSPAGTYFFIATGTKGGGEEFMEKGHVTLTR